MLVLALSDWYSRFILDEFMNRPVGLTSVAFLGIGLFFGSTAVAQRLEFLWKKDFPKSVSWYVRTSQGILLVKSGKSLTALDGKDGRELWELADVRLGSTSLADMPGALERGLNVLEVPGRGVLLLNGARLPINAERRVISRNLITGERLWDAAPVDAIMTAIPLSENRQIVAASSSAPNQLTAAPP